MCIIITIGSDIPFEALESCEAGGLYIKKETDPFFKNNMPKAISFGNLIDGHCSCSLYPSNAWRVEDKLNKQRVKYMKKGYSEQKIERIINDMDNHDRLSYDNSVKQIFKKILEKSKLIYVYCHMYTGGVDDQKLPMEKQITISAECFDDNIETWLPENTIVFITNAGKRNLPKSHG
jgi:hypothetical protein